MTTLLRLEDVEVRAGDRTLLRVPALEVHAGETLAILGETGAGKSTLLRVMNALVRPARGRYRWHGAEVRCPAPLAVRRRMAMAFQQPLLFAGTVFDNVAYGLRLRGERGAGLAARVRAALQSFGIEALARQSVRTLSGGEAQRTALARAVVLAPELLLLDEPLASLDPPTRERLEAELRRVIRERGLTCAYVTHDQREAQALADRVAVLDAGALLQVGTPDDVFLRPATERVARFVGTRNVVAGEITRDGDGATVTVTVGARRVVTAAVSPGATAVPPGATAVLLCVRPEAIVLERGPDPGASRGENRLPATVRELRAAGPTTEVTLDCGFPLVVLVTRRTADELALREGDLVHACFRAAAAHVIPA